MIPLDNNEILMLRGNSGVIGIVKAGTRNIFFLDTEDEEIVLGLEPEDLLVSSGFDTEETTVNGIRCVLYMLREVGAPLIVLPKNHPASKRLRIVVSVGSRTRISCEITPGTHPEQDILCGVDEFSGVEILGVPGGVEFRNLGSGSIERMPFAV